MAEFTTREITYFSRPGAPNTGKAIELAVKRAGEGDVGKVVVASSTGETGLKVFEAFRGTGVNVIVVVLSAGKAQSAPGGEWTKNKKKYEDTGIKYVQGIHALSGIERAVRMRWDTAGPALLISDALRLSGEGFKVGVEIAVMTADAGCVSPDEKILTISGTGRGADTVLVVKPAYSGTFFDFAIQEIVCKPVVFGVKHEAR